MVSGAAGRSWTPEQRTAEEHLDSAVQRALDAGLTGAEITELVAGYLFENADEP